MDVYVHGPNLVGLGLFDEYSSMVWTERYSDSSECIFEVQDTYKGRQLLQEGNFLSIPDSDEVVLIDTFDVEDRLIKVSGKALDDFLNQRFIKPSWDNQFGTVNVVGLPYNLAGYLVKEFAADPSGIMGSGAVTGAADGIYEIIPNLEIADPDIVSPEDYVSIEFGAPIGPLYDAVKKICDTFGYGFKLVPVDITEAGYRLIFKVYEGRNRTSMQSLYEPVQFNSALDNLVNTKEFRSIKGYKNVAWAYASSIQYTAPLIGRAFATPADRFKIGFERRVLNVDVSDVQASDVNLTTTAGRAAFVRLLDQRAKTALINNNYVRLVDGELVPQDAYQYKVHYGLGDIVELTVDTGDSSFARVTEYIYSQDSSGTSAYPTLSAIS